MQRTTLPLNIFFSLLIVIMLARILADVSAYKLDHIGRGSSKAPATHAATARQTTPDDITKHAQIIEQGLFGAATKGRLIPLSQQTANASPPASIPQSDLLLLGTAAGSPRESFVLIRRLSTNEERVFRIGERVFDLGLLYAVHKETADIKNGPQVITLRTPQAPAEADKPPVAAAQPVQQGVVMSPSGGSGVIEQRALNAALDNIGQAMTDARLLPSVKDGKVEGFRVSEIKPQGVFAAVGLKNGDVLLKINEFPIDSPEKAIQSFMTLKGQNRIKLDLLRDGAPTSLTYDIR